LEIGVVRPHAAVLEVVVDAVSVEVDRIIRQRLQKSRALMRRPVPDASHVPGRVLQPPVIEARPEGDDALKGIGPGPERRPMRAAEGLDGRVAVLGAAAVEGPVDDPGPEAVALQEPEVPGRGWQPAGTFEAESSVVEDAASGRAARADAVR